MKFYLVHQEARRRALEAVRTAQDGHSVEVKPPGRTLSQNSLLWPLLTAFSEQLEWPVNGVLCKLTPDEWKTILSAGLRQEHVRVSPGMGGGMVMLGASTSKMSKAEFSELIEFIMATAADRGVKL